MGLAAQVRNRGSLKTHGPTLVDPEALNTNRDSRFALIRFDFGVHWEFGGDSEADNSSFAQRLL